MCIGPKLGHNKDLLVLGRCREGREIIVGMGDQILAELTVVLENRKGVKKQKGEQEVEGEREDAALW